MEYANTRLVYVEGGMWGLLRSLTGDSTSNCKTYSTHTVGGNTGSGSGSVAVTTLAAPKPLDGNCPKS